MIAAFYVASWIRRQRRAFAFLRAQFGGPEDTYLEHVLTVHGADIARHQPDVSAALAADAPDRAFLVQKLRDSKWNISATAQAIGTPRSNLYKKLEQYGITQEKDG